MMQAVNDQSVNPDSSRVIPIDIEHTGIRLALPLLTVVGFVGGYALSSVILTALNTDIAVGCVSFIIAVGCALLAASLGDYVLKRVWSSGRRLIVNPDGLRVEDRRKGKDITTELVWANRINPISWRFKVSRGSARVQKGSIMLGLKLLQDEQEVTMYTFMPEKTASALPMYAQFTPLVSRYELESDKLPLREKSEQRRLLKAEEDRWQDGAELRHEDFSYLILTLAPHLADWQAGAS